MSTKKTKQLIESYNKANIIALEDIISKGAGALVKINTADKSTVHLLEEADIKRAKKTIANLSAQLSDEYVAEVQRMEDRAMFRRHDPSQQLQ